MEKALTSGPGPDLMKDQIGFNEARARECGVPESWLPHLMATVMARSFHATFASMWDAYWALSLPQRQHATCPFAGSAVVPPPTQTPSEEGIWAVIQGKLPSGATLAQDFCTKIRCL